MLAHPLSIRSLPALLLGLMFAASVEASVAWRRIDSSPHGILPSPPASVPELTSALAFNANGDGAAEFVVAGRKGAPALTLWRYSGGKWTTEIIEPDALRIEAGGAVHDIDGDGDLDIAFGADNASNQLWWWENPHPGNGRWTRRLIKNEGSTKHHDQVFGDFDGDGRTDFVSWNQNGRALLFFKIPANPRETSPWPATTIFQWSGIGQYEGLARHDVDGDGVDDIIGAGRWFRHTGAGKFDVEIVDPDRKMTFVRAAAGQLVNGGRPELVFVPGDADGPLQWYHWQDGRWKAHTLEQHIVHGHSLEIADIDGDGHLDVFVGEMGHWTIDRVSNPHSRLMIFYGDGKGNFRKQIVSIGQGVHEARVADLNGDGRLDILGKPFRHNLPKVAVWLNQGNLPVPLPLDRWERHLVDGPLTPPDSPLPPRDRPKRILVDAVDLDGDGYPDIVTGDSWFRNPGRLGKPWTRNRVGKGFGNFAVTYDFDGDGDLDLLGTTGTFKGNQFVLALNEGGGRFTLRTDLPAGTGDFLQGAVVGRLANRKVMVALSWHKGKAIEALSYALGAFEQPWALTVLSSESLNEQLTIGDIDRDTDPDLLLGTQWLRNDNDSWSQHRIGTVGDLGPGVKADRSRLADINGDGRLDAVVGLENGTQVFWFEQPEGDPTQGWTRHLIGESAGQGFSLDVADFDGDGDKDVIVGEHRNPDDVNRVILFENIDGKGGEWRPRVIDQGPANVIDHHDGTLAVDLDGDGDLDIVSIGWHNSAVWVIENKALNPR